MISDIKHHSIIFLIGLAFISGCMVQGREITPPDKKSVTVRDLYREIRSQRKILIIDGWENPLYSQKLRQLTSEFYMDNWQVLVKRHDEVTLDEFVETPVMLIGTPENNHWIGQLIKDLPFSLEGNRINFSDQQYSLKDHAVVLSHYPNPLNAIMPLGLFTSAKESLIWDLTEARIASLIRGNWNYEVVHDQMRVLIGNFSQQFESRWEVDPTQQITLPEKVLHRWESDGISYNSYQQELDPVEIGLLQAEHRRLLFSINKMTGVKLEDSAFAYYLYPSTELKGLMTGNADQSHLDFERNEVHTAFDSYFKDRYFGKENQLLIRGVLGKPTHEILELGLAVYLSSGWEKEGYQYWSNHLIAGGNGLTIAQLLDSESSSRYSTLIVEAIAASLVSFLIDYWGSDEFVSKYQIWQPDSKEIELLNSLWWQQVMTNREKTPSIQRKELAYLQGFNFTHEGYQIYNGYGSVKSERLLNRLHKLGSNAIAVVPYSWMRDPGEASPLRFSNRAGMETDAGVLHTIYKAKENNMFTILKPHVWISNGWPGDVEMATDEDWERFFENYYHWISHYALLAEMHQVEALCIGVEFAKASLSQEKRWRDLIGKVRKIYSGNLTYAANWGEEFENIEFWDQLDFIGLNCYYPLSNDPSASEKDLEQGFLQVLKKIEKVKSRYGKPVVITEIGFRSIDAPWLQPHEEAGNREYNEGDQAKAYSAVFKALDKQQVVDGLLWWKWPTHLEMRTEQDRRFVPTGKKAERVISNWFN